MLSRSLKILLFSISIISQTGNSVSKEELFKMDEIDKKQLELDKRERLLKQNTADLENLSQYVALIHKQQIELVSSGGLTSRVTAMQSQFKESLDQWNKIIDLFKNVTPENVLDIMDQFPTLISQAYENQSTLENTANEIFKSALEQYNFLIKMENYSPTIFAENAETISKLNQLKAPVISGYEKIMNQCGSDTLTKFRTTVNSFKKILDIRLTNIALELPHLREQIRASQDLLTVVDTYYAKIGQLSSSVLKLEKNLDRGAIYTSLVLYQGIEKDFKEIALSLNQFTAKEESKRETQILLNFQFDRAKKNIEQKLASRDKVDIFAEFSSKQLKKLSKICKQDMTTPKVDCEFLRTLTRFNVKPSVLKQRIASKDMTEDDLKFVESKLIEIDRGWSL